MHGVKDFPGFFLLFSNYLLCRHASPLFPSASGIKAYTGANKTQSKWPLSLSPCILQWWARLVSLLVEQKTQTRGSSTIRPHALVVLHQWLFQRTFPSSSSTTGRRGCYCTAFTEVHLGGTPCSQEPWCWLHTRMHWAQEAGALASRHDLHGCFKNTLAGKKCEWWVWAGPPSQEQRHPKQVWSIPLWKHW